MSQILIYDLRLTFLWAEAIQELLQGESAPPGSLLPFLWSQDDYQARFAALLEGQKDPLGLEPPWRYAAGNHFWTFYLEKKTPGAIPAKEAWRLLVPFRGKAPVRVEVPGAEKASTSVEAFYYPHGVGLALSIRLVGTWSLAEAVGLALRVKSDPLNVTWEGGQEEKLNAAGFGRKALQALGRLVAGPDWPGTGGEPRAFTVVTVVRGEGVDPTVPLADAIRKALHGLTTWSPAWNVDQPKPLDEAVLPIRKTSPKGHVLYADTRGRAVWAPGLFAPELNGKRLLGCYHRNLSMLSLQVESLACLAELTAQTLDHGGKLGTKHEGCANRAVGILARLYGGVESTYQSRSPRVQIDQGGFRQPIDAVRKHFKRDPLHAETPKSS